MFAKTLVMQKFQPPLPLPNFLFLFFGWLLAKPLQITYTLTIPIADTRGTQWATLPCMALILSMLLLVYKLSINYTNQYAPIPPPQQKNLRWYGS